MSKIHITLVGGQPIPVYLGIINDADCEEVIFIHSDLSLKEAQTIQKYCNKHCSLVLCSPTDLVEIRITAERIRHKLDGADVTLNITSGTKPWSLIFYQIFSDYPSVQYIYIDQLNNCYDLKSGLVQTLSLDVFKRFELYGTPLKRYLTLDYFTESDFNAVKDIEAVRKINIGAFTDLTNRDANEYNTIEGELFARNLSHMIWNWSEGWVEFEIINYLGIPSKPVRIEAAHIKELTLNTSWFELKTAIELSKVPNVKNIYLNCEFLSKDEKAKNEIDIIADFGTRLVFVECKTMINEITDIDKFRSAMRNFSGTSSTGLFVTNDKVGNNNVKRYGRYMAAMEKCKDNDILTFNFGFWNKKEETSLNAIVNRAITKINKR